MLEDSEVPSLLLPWNDGAREKAAPTFSRGPSSSFGEGSGGQSSHQPLRACCTDGLPRGGGDGGPDPPSPRPGCREVRLGGLGKLLGFQKFLSLLFRQQEE